MHADPHDSERTQRLDEAIDTLIGPTAWQWLLGKHNVARIDITIKLKMLLASDGTFLSLLVLRFVY